MPSKYVYDGKTYSYVCNAHGDVVALLDEDGKTVNTYKYDIWGQLLESNETVPNAIRYNHEYYDTESGFYYLRVAITIHRSADLQHQIQQRTA